MSAEYDYTKPVNIPQLKDEMSTAGLPVSTDIQLNDVQVQVFFADPLTAQQQSTLDSVMANHVPSPNYVTLAARAGAMTLLSYLNNADLNTQNVARAVIVSNLAPRLPDGLVATINDQIAARLSGG